MPPSRRSRQLSPVESIELSDRMDWPIDSTELARRLGFGGYPDSNYALDHLIRPLLKQFNCPKAGSGRRSKWLIDQPMAFRVADRLGRSFRP